MTSTVNKTAHPFDKPRLEALLNRRFFYAPAFEIYGGVAGLYDYGPPGSSLQANIIAEWRKHFIVEEHMLELDTSIMTPAPVFETSGHVARFADWMVKDAKTGDVLRADHLVKNVLEARLAGDREARGLAAAPPTEDKKKKKKAAKTTAIKLEDEVVAEYEAILAQAGALPLLLYPLQARRSGPLDNYSGADIWELCRKHNLRNPDTDNEVGEPQLFNLMFTSSIGPTGQHPGYLRPETAQGHFLNFSRLLDFNNGRIPFASAQIGRSFRNEISPRAGLLRVREFTMAEIEHYVDPEDKRHARFNEVRDVKVVLLDRHVQEAGKSSAQEITIGEAVDKGIIANETLGYFVARIYQFLLKIGINPQRLRFRQHMANEMAHYATDCWDAEIHNSTGWTETGHPLVVRQALKEPIVFEREVAEWDKKTLGKTFKQDAGVIQKTVEAMDQEQLVKVKGELAQGKAVITSSEGKQFELSPEVLTIERKTIKQSIREYTPNVIEPSFGLGRVLYTLLEHSFWSREQDVERGVLSLPPLVAPTKVLIVPLSAREEFDPLVKEVSSKFRKAGIFARVDDSNTSIGKRYARNDELGTPYGVTLDFASVQNRTMTLRERDTMDQRIGSIDEVVGVVTDLVNGNIEWEEACQRLPAYDGVQAIE
ncbi:hypothetical protein NLJ89_g7168 [Agrocybe chaxingu]|uniref:glycine--tRNA ligase n=1 Tax=Agrocybe chaxingu TaxID=84603 RepID=A0A9W8JWW3_9AGAR|nr:hypothetical protein NLJ89_g7168 [Agrocybe chaxingu]